MLLWILFAILTALAAILVISPYWRNGGASDVQLKDVAVYKQQLAEIEDEKARGLLGEAEAEAARIEISRRILKAGGQEQAAVVKTATAPYAAVTLLAAISMGTYLYFGSPNLPDQPLAARMGPDHGPVENLIARAEERLQAHPEDGEGWGIMAHVYMRMGRYGEAAAAYRKMIELLGATPERKSQLGEALTLANGGAVSEEASELFKAVLAEDPADNRAAFWLAAEQERKGALPEAAAGYRKLLERELPEQARQVIAARLARIDTQLSGKAPPIASQAAGMSQSEQSEMINQMVAGLAERLKSDGSDLEGWLKLMRAYTVLGRRDDALSAMNDARSNFAGNDQALARIDEFAKSLGLQS